MIHGLGAQDALEMAQVLELEEAVAIAHERIIYVENFERFAQADRLIWKRTSWFHSTLSHLPGTALVVHRLGFMSLPPHEDGIQRADLLKHLLKPLTIPVWGFGGLQASHLNGLRDIGFSGCVLDSEAARPVDDAHPLTWP